MIVATDAATGFLTVAQLAGLFHVSPQTIAGWRKTQKLPQPVKVGRRWLWKPDDIDAHLERLAAKAG
jgi:predicted DNA-binding transcriptional regulator AlpA